MSIKKKCINHSYYSLLLINHKKKLSRKLNSMTRKLCNLLTCLISKNSQLIIKNTYNYLSFYITLTESAN